jgi:hypothetical protein
MTMWRSQQHSHLAAAAAICFVAAAVSPIGIRLATGRLDLSPRVNVLSMVLVVCLLTLAGALLASGRVRRAFFHLLMWMFPVALLAVAEAGAVATRFADRIAPIEDMSTLVNRDRWPAELMSSGRRVVVDGLTLYRPFEGAGVSINELGLRTPPPSPKKPGEWRIAITGGSCAMGWRVPDADTIAVQLQHLFRQRGHSNVTVYNFAIDSIELAQELNVLKRFREVYAIDHAIFYTGGNDATSAYVNAMAPADGFAGLLSGVNQFELLKVAGRLQAVLLGPPPGVLAKFDNDIIPKLAKANALRDGVIAADGYCRMLGLRCDFILQPMLTLRTQPVGPERRLSQSINRIYPRYRELTAAMYRTAVGAGATVRDGGNLFANSPEPYFFDVAHINEAGNRYAAAQIAASILANLPGPEGQAKMDAGRPREPRL